MTKSSPASPSDSALPPRNPSAASSSSAHVSTPSLPVYPSPQIVVDEEQLESFRFDSEAFAQDSTLDPEVPDPSQLQAETKNIEAKARITDDGRIAVDVKTTHLPDLPPDYYLVTEEPEPYVEKLKEGLDGRREDQVPKLNILLLIVGSRGDVQPYISLSLALVADGHRVRLGTHAEFETFVLEAGRGLVEFFDIGGDPRDLMAYMVKNPGLMPGFESLTNGDIRRKTKMIFEIMSGSFKAAFYPNAAKDTAPFVADALISNPPVFAHIHIAETLGIPLHMSFTMPWTPTTSFCHPLVQLESSGAEPRVANYLTYTLANQMTWSGLSGSINTFRTKTLGLEALKMREGPSVLDRLKLPWIYSFSPGLIPKPNDWRANIDLAGFFFLDLASDYRPPAALLNFLQAGPPPIYIGFGSVPVKDPQAMSRTLFSAVQAAGVRAIISSGWAGLASTSSDPNIFVLDFAVPHDYLFTKMSAVVHHGGAGTTAIGLLNGLPTLVVPFFGDQVFWGEMIARAGAGPKPIPSKDLNVERLVEGIRFLMSPGTADQAKKLGAQIRSERGERTAIDAFYSHLPLQNMRCDLDPTRVAVWWCKKYRLRLSAFAAQVLIDDGKIKGAGALKLHRVKEYDTKQGASDPILGAASPALNAIKEFTVDGLGQMFINPLKSAKAIGTMFPKALYNTMDGITTGLENAPKLYGSEVRKKGKISGVGSGFKEGGMSFAENFVDGIMGLYKDPVKGYKEGGASGAAIGVSRSLANLAIKPAAGIFSLFNGPMVGIYEGVRSLIVTQDTKRLRAVRTTDGLQHARSATQHQRGEILQMFWALEGTVKDRKKLQID